MNQTKYPSLFQVNTRVWLTEISGLLKRKATLDDIPDASLDDFVQRGFDWVWFLSVWTTGALGQKISREHSGWRNEFEETLHDLKEEDIAGSGFAITDYHVHPELGGDDALQRLRERMHKRGLRLMLDFVPNHMGPDHSWVKDHPEYFVQGTQSDIELSPQNYFKSAQGHSDLIFAYGRDPYFSGWPDTIQLDYSHPATVEVMKQELLRISGQCDGLRCDMAMLMLPDVFEKTWGRKAQSFWPEAIHAVRNQHHGFCFMAEVYWDLEWALQQQGFDFTYDKRLYDRLAEGNAIKVREHFCAGLDYQDKLVRFLENHDEPRASAAFEIKKHEAAAVITFLSPGLRFFHQGQFEGKKKHISPHLVRAPQEVPDADIHKFYASLLNVLRTPVFRNGTWKLLECVPAWDGNGSWEDFIAFAWEGEGRAMAIVVANYAPHDGQCYLRIPFPEIGFGQWQLQDMMNDVIYERHGSDLVSNGLYLGMKPWQYHVFDLKK